MPSVALFAPHPCWRLPAVVRGVRWLHGPVLGFEVLKRRGRQVVT